MTDEEFDRLLREFNQQAIHLETRDAYGTEVGLPHMARWIAGEPDDLTWLEEWCTALREHAAAGKSVRRARVVSEPLSEYQRWSHSIAPDGVGRRGRPLGASTRGLINRLSRQRFLRP
ncbi:MAG TPA: hypothetical protein VGM60_12680 [Pseudonocardia sp.]